MKLIPIACPSCAHCNQLPALRELTVYRCEHCRQLNKLNLTHRLAVLREAEHRYPAPTFLRPDRRAGLRR